MSVDVAAREADAILAWAVAGWVDYQARGLAEPDAVLRATERYQADADAIGRFLADACLINPHMWVGVGELFDRWAAWSAEDGAEPVGKRTFGEAMDTRGFPAVKGTGGVRIRRGIGLASDEGDDR